MKKEIIKPKIRAPAIPNKVEKDKSKYDRKKEKQTLMDEVIADYSEILKRLSLGL